MARGEELVSKLVYLALVLLLLISGCGAQSGRPTDELVSIGTHSLQVYCIGAGSPTIVIDVGAGDSYSSWQSVQEQLAQDTRVCAFDRAGYGESEAGPMPRDSQRAADELLLLLANSGEVGPFLLVGHSLGGLNVQVFAASYQQEVTGLVLLDPSPIGWLMGEGYPELREVFEQETSAMRMAAQAARASADPEQQAQAAFLEALASEHEELFGRTAEQVNAIASFGGVPLTVVGAAIPDPRFGESSAAFRQFWNDESRKLAAKSKGGRFILAEGSSHQIHLDAPQLVIDVVRQMLADSSR
jgi:pimeloyl-ACP methyl ester carboxylesterase